MVSPFQQPPAVGDMRRARRKQFAQELAQGLQTGVGGLDMLEDAKRRAGLDKERQQDRAAKQQAADLDRKTQEAQLSDLLARAKRRAVTDAQADEDRAVATSAATESRDRARIEAGQAAERKALAESRETLRRFVAGGVQAGQSLEQITEAARSTPGLEALTGDEEVAAEFRAQEQADALARAKAKALAGEKEPSIVDVARVADLEASTALKKKKLAAPSGGISEKEKARRAEKAAQDTDDLRKEFNALPEVKEYQSARAAYGVMEKAAAADSPAADMQLIYAFMKTQDPESAVREGEFQMAARSGSFGDQIAAWGSKYTTGMRLTPTQRADLLSRAGSALGAREVLAAEQAKRYLQIAEKRGHAPEDLLPPGLTPRAPAPQASSQPPAPSGSAVVPRGRTTADDDFESAWR